MGKDLAYKDPDEMSQGEKNAVLGSLANAGLFPLNHPMAGIPTFDHSAVAEYYNDFMSISDSENGDWIVTDVVGSGASFVKSGNSRIGAAVFTPPLSAGNQAHVILGDTSGAEQGDLRQTIGERLGYACRIFPNDDDFVWLAGLIEDSADLNASNDGLFFRHTGTNGDNKIEFVSKVGGVEQVLEVFASPLGEDRFLDLGFNWNGIDSIKVYRKEPRAFSGSDIEVKDKNWVFVGELTDLTKMPLTDPSSSKQLAPAISITNTPGGASQLTIDYINFALERR